jgi:hypothetical protein
MTASKPRASCRWSAGPKLACTGALIAGPWRRREPLNGHRATGFSSTIAPTALPIHH